MGSKRSTVAKLAELYPKNTGNPDTLRRSSEFRKLYEYVAASIGSDLPQDLIDRKCRDFERLRNSEKREPAILRLPAKPIAIVHFGDPHLDDDGCDFPLLRHHVKLVQARENVWAGNVGDTTNNWVGRLQALYSKQHSTVEEAFQLAEWFCRSMNWLYFVLGNHDVWNNGDVLLNYLLRSADVLCRGGHNAKVSIAFDNGVLVNVGVRHDFKGRSQYHTTHGALKQHLFGDRWADLLVSGHTHDWGLLQKETEDGKPRWSLRIAGYKKYDSYADQNGYYRHAYGSACCTVIDPRVLPPDRIICFWDIETGLKYLDLIGG